MKKSSLQFILYVSYAILLTSVSMGNNPTNNINSALIRTITQPDTVIQVSGGEQQLLNLALPDGGVPPVPGVLNLELLRTTRDAPELADGDGWTYAHHMDLAEWRGRLYAAWNMTEKDEDVPPSKVVYASSADGVAWSKPADLFPRELAWACRFYFFHTKNDRMLTFCAARLGDGIVTEAQKSVLLVREILPDHSLGKVFTLIHPMEKMPPFFETSSDKAFTEACREAVNNNMLLEQQDYGVFLGNRKMSWHATTPQFNGHYPFGKAFSFFQRQDRQWVGISKMGFVTTSADEGKSWSQPVNPPSLVAGAAKVWGQRTNDNQYVLAYNPDPKRGKRFPLVMVFGNDGIHFRDMRVVHGEYPPMRYPGKYKDFGYQYVRGVAAWSTDHSFADKSAIWLIYSVHKEDIWLSRIPLPVHAQQDLCPSDNFQKAPVGAIVKDWNIYSPKWAPVTIAGEPGKPNNRCLELRDGDPTDYARAMRLFPAAKKITAKFRIKTAQSNALMEIDLQDDHGNLFSRISFTNDGELKASSGTGETSLGSYSSGKWVTFEISADGEQRSEIIKINGITFKIDQCGSQNLNKIQRLVFRTGQERKLGDTDALTIGQDKPLANPARFSLDDITVK